MRKPLLHRYLDLLYMVIRWDEMSSLYFAQGMDLRGKRIRTDYLAYERFRHLRDARNRRPLPSSTVQYGAGRPARHGAVLQASLRHQGAWRIPHGLGTVRVVTCIDAGKAKLLFAALKITVGDNATDNFHYGTTGNLLACIDLETGTLHAARGSASKDWPAMTSISHHPDTGNAIEGFVLPAWSELVALALKAQDSLPQLKTVGWDVTLTADGPVLVEANNTYSVDILQVAYRRGLKRQILRHLALSGDSADS